MCVWKSRSYFFISYSLILSLILRKPLEERLWVSGSLWGSSCWNPLQHHSSSQCEGLEQLVPGKTILSNSCQNITSNNPHHHYRYHPISGMLPLIQASGNAIVLNVSFFSWCYTLNHTTIIFVTFITHTYHIHPISLIYSKMLRKRPHASAAQGWSTQLCTARPPFMDGLMYIRLLSNSTKMYAGEMSLVFSILVLHNKLNYYITTKLLWQKKGWNQVDQLAIQSWEDYHQEPAWEMGVCTAWCSHLQQGHLPLQLQGYVFSIHFICTLYPRFSYFSLFFSLFSSYSDL